MIFFPSVRSLASTLSIIRDKGPDGGTVPSIWSIYTYMHDKRPCCLLRRPREIEFSFSLDAAVLHNALHKHKQTILYGNFSLWLKNIKEGIYHVLPKHVVQCSWPLIAIHKSPGYGLERCEHCHRVVPTKRIGDTCMPEGGTHHHHHYTSANLGDGTWESEAKPNHKVMIKKTGILNINFLVQCQNWIYICQHSHLWDLCWPLCD